MKPWKKNLLKEWWEKYPDYLPLGAKWRGLWQHGQVKIIIKELDERRLDIDIAQQVFGHTVDVKEETEYLDYGGQVEYPELMYLAEVYSDGSGERWELLPHYSIDIKDAFLIVDHLKMNLSISHLKSGNYLYCTNLIQDDWFISKTIPLAICEAALR